MKVFYIDPQSYNNLSLYDLSLLSHVPEHEITYYCNRRYQCGRMPVADAVRRFTYSDLPGCLLKTLSYTWSLLLILMDALRRRPDVVHIQWLRFWPVDYVFAWLLKRRGVRVVFTAHNILPHNVRRGDEKCYRKYYRLVDRIIVHTRCTKDELCERMGIAPEKVEVIAHGLLQMPLPEEQVQARVEELRRELNVGADDLVFACLGVQNLYKGTDLVVRAWMECPELRDNPHCRLLIVGRNQNLNLAPLQGQPNAHVRAEMISDLDFEAYLRLTSLLLLPYRRISQSGLLLTAVSSGVPVLVSEVGGLTEPLGYGAVGWSMGEPTYENLSRSLVRLASSADELRRMRANEEAFCRVRAAYSWAEIGCQTGALYARLR